MKNVRIDEVNGIVKFKIDNDDFVEFNYESLNCIISIAVANDEEIIVNCEEKFKNYKLLITNLIEEVRTEDFKNALKLVEEAKKEYEDAASLGFEEES